MRRRLFNLAAAVSLVLCIAALAGLIRTQFVTERLRYSVVTERPTGRTVITRLALGSRGGSLTMSRTTTLVNPATTRDFPLTEGLTYARGTPTARGLTFGRFAWQSGAVPDHSTVVAAVPWWFLAGVTAALPAAWLVRRLRASRRFEAGHCPTCGYDCRATPERCPECGRELEAKDEG